MGYYTHYSLEVRGIKNTEEHASLREIIENFGCFQEDEFDFSNSAALFLPEDETTWYNHEEDMINISKQFPNMTFCLEGVGEDREDMWRKYFHNGTVEYCPARISFPDPIEIKWEY